MLPRIFRHNFQNPVGNISPHIRYHSYETPFIVSFQYHVADNIYNCALEVCTDSLLGEDVIYTLPSLPPQTKLMDYKIQVRDIVPDCRDIYHSGLFTNSLFKNLLSFDKFDFLYMPTHIAERVDTINTGGCDMVHMNVHGVPMVQAGVRRPSEVTGSLYVAKQKIPSKKQTSKQTTMCFRSCIFK